MSETKIEDASQPPIADRASAPRPALEPPLCVCFAKECGVGHSSYCLRYGMDYDDAAGREHVCPGLSPCADCFTANLLPEIVARIKERDALASALERALTHLRASMAGRAHVNADEAIAEAESALALVAKGGK